MEISAYSPVKPGNISQVTTPRITAKSSLDSVHFGAKKDPCTEGDEANKLKESINCAIDKRDAGAMQKAIADFAKVDEKTQIKLINNVDLLNVCIKNFGSKTTDILLGTIKKVKPEVKKAYYENPSCLKYSVSDFSAEAIEYVLDHFKEAVKINPGAVASWKPQGGLLGGGQLNTSWFKMYPKEMKESLKVISKNIEKLPSKQVAKNFIETYWDVIKEEDKKAG